MTIWSLVIHNCPERIVVPIKSTIHLHSFVHHVLLYLVKWSIPVYKINWVITCSVHVPRDTKNHMWIVRRINPGIAMGLYVPYVPDPT